MSRDVFTINRQLEFFSESELEKQLGHSRPWWRAVLVGELVDNALDHCEEAGILPSIAIRVTESAITVADNGRGIPPAVVASMADFETRTSSRLGYATPTRGAQGNAGKCLLALPYVLSGSEGHVQIDAAGVCHDITATMDVIARIPVIKHLQLDGKVQIGTSITVELPCSPGRGGTERIVSLVEEYAALNPHATFEVDYFGELLSWERSTDTIAKWTAKAPDPAHWYDLPYFENLIASVIQFDRSRGESRTVREFVRTFAGLKRSDSVKAVLDDTGLTRCDLSNLVGPKGIDSKKAESLLVAMQQHSDPPKPAKLGVIGKEHIEASIGQSVQYKKVQGTTKDGLPFIVEAAFAERDEGNLRVFTGLNFSVDIRTPAYSHFFELLERCRVSDYTPTDVFLHITKPRVRFTNRGKTDFDLCPTLETAIEQAVQSVTKQFTAKMKAAERDATRLEREVMKTAATCSLKDAIYAVMTESVDIVSQNDTCDFSARNHYYIIRKLIQDYTSKELRQGYLDKVIDDWEAKHGIIERRTRDPRGFLLEPHTNKQIPLGTRQVDGYVIPPHLYHTIIYVEKKGLLPNFQYGRIAEKYDAAIICAEGYAVRAAQSLMQAAANGHAMRVFVFHDADPYGYSIANAIGESSGAHAFNFEIIDAGLRLDEALELGLPTETFTRTYSLPKSIKLTPTERKLFEGTKHIVTGRSGSDRPQWTGCQRVELNALAANPKQFVEWVESKLQAHGAAKKLVPGDDVILDRVKSTFEERRRERVNAAVTNALDIPAIVADICDRLQSHDFSGAPAAIKQWAKRLESSPWSGACELIAVKALAEQREKIKQAVQEAIQ